MRQQNNTGYELVSGDLGRVIGAGEKFEYPQLITGCTDLDAQEASEDEGAEDAGGTAETGAPDDPQTAVEAAKDASAPQGEPKDKPRTKGARQ